MLLTLGIAVIGVVMASGRRSTGAILAVLGADQLAMHALLSLDTMDMSAMGMDVASLDGVTMIGTHAVAVPITAVLLAKADAAVFMVAAALARLLPTVLVAPPVLTAPALLRPSVAPRIRATAVLLCRDNARRGPPVAA